MATSTDESLSISRLLETIANAQSSFPPTLCLPFTPTCNFFAAHSSIYRTGCMNTLHFYVSFTFPLPLSLPFSFTLFLPSCHSVHCPLSIVRCLLSAVCLPCACLPTRHVSLLFLAWFSALSRPILTPFWGRATASSALMTCCCSDMDATSAAASAAAAVCCAQTRLDSQKKKLREC